MKIELSIKVDYLPGWGVFEGVRELLQNAKDAETELGAPMTVRVRPCAGDLGVLVIENEGCTLPYEALLLGHTTKSNRGDLIGKFGEGFKLGILALLRAGHAVTIRNGGEVWTPTIALSEKFAGAKVLVFDIQKGRKDTNRLAIEVSGISSALFRDAIAPRFLWLTRDPDPDTVVVTAAGTLLLGEAHRGRLFVKGIFVETKPELTVGFDFRDAEVDRDRKMVQSYDFQWRARSIWTQALAMRDDLFAPFLALVAKGSPDVADMDAYFAGKLPQALVDDAAADFLDRHGDDAVPVSTLGEGQDLEHYGRKGVLVTDGMRAILERTRGPLAKVKADLATEATRVYSWHELTPAQQVHLARALRLVNGASAVTLDEIQVCDFRSPDLHGLFAPGRIQLSARTVADRAACLQTLVHEVAHRAGGDGEKGHVAQIERIWSAIVENLGGVQ